MERLKGFIKGQAALVTECLNEKERLDMIDPFPEDLEEYMNKGQEKDEMWVWDGAAIKVSEITLFNEYAPGVVRVEASNKTGLSLRGSVEELLELL